jgi:hypothetical protein
MKRVWCWIGLVGALLALPGVVCAQGLFSFGSADSCNRLPCDAVSTLEFYAGWLESRRGLEFGIQTDTPGPIPIDVLSVEYSLPTRGVWFGAETTIPISNSVTLFGKGWMLAPQRTSVDGAIILGFPIRESQESNNMSWWYLDALAGYNLLPKTALLAGVRFEQHQNTLKNRTWGAGGASIPGVEGQTELNLVSWIPLFGISTTVGGRTSTVKVSAFYTPVFSSQVDAKMGFTAAAPSPTFGPGLVEVKGTASSGYFYEAMLEYSTYVMGANLGAFARLSCTHGQAKNMKMTWNGANWPPGLDVPYSSSFDRTGWTVGGSLSVDFAIGSLAAGLL